MRPGRFDRQVVVPKPDVKGREQILGVHTRKIPLDPDVKLDVLAKGTPGFTGADLANLANEAAIHAAGINLATVTMDCFEMAKDKVMMGRGGADIIGRGEKSPPPRAGHAIVATLTPGADPSTRSHHPARMALGSSIISRSTSAHYSQVYLRTQHILIAARAESWSR